MRCMGRWSDGRLGMTWLIHCLRCMREKICVESAIAALRRWGLAGGMIHTMLFERKKRRITRLLLVEDEPLVAFDAEHLLIAEHYEVIATVDRVARAVAIIGDGRAIDLVLVDVELADGSGVDVARAAAGRGIPVLFVTANCPAEASALAVGCLVKPFAQRDLLAAIRAIEATLDGAAPRRLPSGFRLFAQAGLSEPDAA